MTNKFKNNVMCSSSEELIKEAARVIFLKKGFAATRTRDIAEQAGINLALLNYYFKSKEKLFQIIMFETLGGFIESLVAVLNNENTLLMQKVEIIVEKYIDLLLKDPNIPLFILAETRYNPDLLVDKIRFRDKIIDSHFLKQYNQAVIDGVINEPNPLHFLMNMMSLVIFPFISKPIISNIGQIEAVNFKALMEQRKKKIPIWIEVMFSTK